ncbi:hypothetical protein VPH35_067180 [Triticum aestivum]
MATTTRRTLMMMMMIIVLGMATATTASTSRGMPSWVMPEDGRLLLTASPPVDAVVAKDGSGDHDTISAAVAAAPPGEARYIIYIKEGLYQEKVEVLHRSNVMLIEDGAARTVITGNESNRTLGTPCTTTVSAQREGIIIRDVTIQNTAGPEAKQAVALLSNSNKSDTLLAENFLQFYKECEITGTVDFIWGAATAVFQDCALLARRPGIMQQNVLTGQGRNGVDSASGFTFQGCNVTTREDLRGVETYLGRPWQPYARVIFIHCYMDAIVHPLGWLSWDNKKINVTTTTRTVFFAEFENQGPGADVRGRVNWAGFHNIKKASKAAKFTVNNFIDGRAWLPETGVPYKGGL